MSAVGNFFESAVTPRGTNARRGQEARAADIAGLGSGVIATLKPILDKQIGLAGELEDTRQNAIKDTVLSLAPGQLAANGERAASEAKQGTISLLGDIENQFKSQGLSEGAIAGASADVMNSGTEQENAARAAKYDPRLINSIRQQLLQVVTGGAQLPSMTAINQAAGLVYGEPPVQVDKGLGDVIGQGFGMWAGGGFQTK